MPYRNFTGQRFYKKERLCSKYDIDRLFAPRSGGSICDKVNGVHPKEPASVMAYPWRAVWLPSMREGVDFPRMVIVVPKKRLRHAVDRVTMRRRMREAYRRMRESLPSCGYGVDIAFVYVGQKLASFDDCCRSVKKIFVAISRHDSITSDS